MSAYPQALAAAIERNARWEVPFTLAIAAKAAAHGDTCYVSGCLFRAVCLLAHVVHAGAGPWLINEKGAVDAAATLPGAPPDFAKRAHGLFRLDPVDGLEQAGVLADEILR